MAHDNPDMSSTKRLRGRTIILCAIAVLVVMFILSLPAMRINYHRWQLESAFTETFAPEREEVIGGMIGFSMGESYERYEYHRDRLVALKALRATKYLFTDLLYPTEECHEFHRKLNAREAPPYVDYSGEGATVDPPIPYEITIWYWPDHSAEWDEFLEFFTYTKEDL